jgi:hypothetical protein
LVTGVSNRALAIEYVKQQMITAWIKNNDQEALDLECLLSHIENMEDEEFDD